MIDSRRYNFVIVGHVDHGKSTFVGKMLLDLKVISKDKYDFLQNQALQENKKFEYSHLIDSLSDERKNGITIGLSQTIFNYEGQEYAFLDCPGHMQFIQNMVVGASKAETAFLLVDVTEGIQESTLKHMSILSFLGLKKVVVLVNKMDLVDYSFDRFLELEKKLLLEAQNLNLDIQQCVPISAYFSENISKKSENMNWYVGPTVLAFLKNDFTIRTTTAEKKFTFLVHTRYKNYISGKVLTGAFQPDLKIVHVQTTEQIQIEQLVNNGELLSESFLISNDVSVQRGSLLTNSPLQFKTITDFKSSLIWLSNKSLAKTEDLMLRFGKQELPVQAFDLIDSVLSIENKNYLSENILCAGCLMQVKITVNKPLYINNLDDIQKYNRFVLFSHGQIVAAGKMTIS